ncbi:MAG: FAD-dependent oxidoreductase [Candidatus Bipolaricaulota bacterium]|nr:FAD-dependent oxidoreductase [Candidatus Bipolaricaulota bacterium]
MTTYRIDKHPILPISKAKNITFFWQGKQLTASKGEMIASALYANGIRIFGHHPKDGAPQGIFCANGQCSQCLVIANDLPVKSCMTEVLPGMRVEPIDELPRLPQVGNLHDMHAIETIKVDVLILGGGPAGLSAAAELGRRGVDVLLIDDKDRLGGKLVLQTHRFFGSFEAVHAGTRGIDIASLLANEIKELPAVKIWTNSTALAVFSDKKVGVLRSGDEYVLIEPRVLLVATGAREKSLAFKGNTLPGVYGAGAFQTLVNRDRVRAAERLFIIGGGNVGLIAGYHALQAGIEAVGLVEALPECGGYKVHRDKLARLGVPIYTSHTVISANGDDQVESVTIAKIDGRFQPIPGTEKSFACDTILIAVGLDPVNEFTFKAREYRMNVFDAGDAEEIAEASAAIFSGRIKGRMIARELHATNEEIPGDWSRTAQLLKSKPGKVGQENIPPWEEGVFPILHCAQEIPCNPCSAVCPKGLIKIDKTDIRQRPQFIGDPHQCLGCEQCVAICPGLAITLVDYRQDQEMPTVTIAYEFPPESLRIGEKVTVTDSVGETLGDVIVEDLRAITRNNHTVLVKVNAPKEYAKRIAGIRIQDPSISHPLPKIEERMGDDTIICRCERVRAGEIRALIRSGCRDMNEIKAVTRAGMGACGGKTCTPLIKRIFREEGVLLSELEENVKRPLFVEVPLGVFAGTDFADKEEAGDE